MVQVGELEDGYGARIVDRVDVELVLLLEAGEGIQGKADRCSTWEELIGGLGRKGSVEQDGLTTDPAGTSARLGDVVGDECVIRKPGSGAGSDRIGRLTDPVGNEHGTDLDRAEEVLEQIALVRRGCHGESPAVALSARRDAIRSRW